MDAGGVFGPAVRNYRLFETIAYQGTIFLIPFFFLLLDSFWLGFAGVAESWVPLASVVVVVVTGFVAGSVAAGAGAGVVAAFGSPVAPGGLVLVASAG